MRNLCNGRLSLPFLMVSIARFFIPMEMTQAQQLIDELYPILRDTEFVGGAQVGNSAPGQSRMMLRYNESAGHLLQLRISIFNHLSQSSDIMDATYSITSLRPEWNEPPAPPEPEPTEPYVDPIFGLLDEAEAEGELEFTESIMERMEPGYSRVYLSGSVQGLSGSANNGAIRSNTESGPIQLDLDSARMRLEIAFQGSGLYWGSADIDASQYMSLQALLYGESYTAGMRKADEEWVSVFTQEAQE